MNRWRKAISSFKNTDLDIEELERLVAEYFIYASCTRDVETDSLSGFVGTLRVYKEDNEEDK